MPAPRLWGGLLLAALAAPSSAVPVAAGPRAATGTQDPGDAGALDLAAGLGAFIEALGRLRAGEAAAAGELEDLARALCAQHGRCDVVDVARYYVELTPAERAQGLDDEAAFLALREEVVAAGERGLPAGQGWDALRTRLCRELSDLALAVEARADVAPAARAWALVARLELNELDESPGPERAAVRTRAEAHVDQSLALFERTGQVTPRLEPLWVRAQLARARGDRAAARADFEAVRELAGRVRSDAWRERGLLGLVDLAKDVGDLSAVERLLGAIAHFRDPRESWPLAREHAGRLLHADRPDAALAFLLQHPPGAETDRDVWRAMLAVAFLRTGDVAAARREVAALEGGGSEFALRAGVALALAEGQAEAALELIEDPPRPWSAEARAEVAALEGEAWLALGQPAQALGPLRDALEEGLAREGWSEDAGGSAIGEWLGMHAVTLLARAHAELGEGLEAARVIEDPQARRLRPAGERVDGEELQRWAARFERGLVTWGVGADATVVAWVDARGQAAARALPLGRRVLEGAVRRLREALLAGDAARARQLGEEVAAALLPAELRAHLTAGANGRRDGRALFLLHGPLEALPLAALVVEGERLDEHLTPLVLPGLPREAAAPPLDPTVDEWALLGGPWDMEGEVLLPAANRELAQLARLHPRARLASGAAFVEGALREALAGAAPVHLATHLVQVPECDDGRLAPVGLLLSEGQVLCAAEVAALAPQLPLVVLGACSTAGGRVVDAAGTLGLARAFLEGGTRDLLATLWPVQDEAAQAFALAFHRSLERGRPPSVAAREARAALREAGWPAADWAAFRLLGRD